MAQLLLPAILIFQLLEALFQLPLPLHNCHTAAVGLNHEVNPRNQGSEAFRELFCN